MTELPRGTVAFLFTDIQDSTRLWQGHRAAMERAYGRHDAVLRGAVADQGGVVYKVVGDAVQAAFPTAPQAVAAALEVQLGLSLQGWAGLGLPEPLRVRTALHAGDVDPGPDGDYRSPVLNRLGRLLGAGHGGQVLLSQAVQQLARDRLPEEAALRDLGAHRLRDLLEPERVWQLLHPALPALFPALATLDVARHNLPVQPTPVIGREKEVGELTALLRRPEVRLVTLTGPGGTGKTRLALQAAAELVEDFPDGVWFVPLAALTDPGLVPSAIAEALGIREEGGTPLRDTLRDDLRDKRLLLVLDNLEQVLEVAPLVNELLGGAPDLNAITTSRAPLRLRMEREYPVAPLGLPRRKPPPTAGQLSQYAAVQLFLERAQAVRPDFTVSNENAPAIAEICHRLDGLPLAIELAAARVRMFPPGAMLARLEQRLPLLTGGARDLPLRQQTIRAAIAWSYDLLEPDERKLYRRLSVFAGGWTIEAAEAVAGSPKSGELNLDVLAGLDRLVEHSLVRQEEGLEGEPRFAMLETVREYGLERLEQAGEADDARERHLAFFRSLVTIAGAALEGADQVTWLDRLHVEHDNLRAALEYATKRDPSAALQLSSALFWFWRLRGHLSEGRDWLGQALDLGASAPSVQRIPALDAAAWLAAAQTDTNRAVEHFAELLSLARAAGDRAVMASALGGLGQIAGEHGDWTEAIRLTEEALSHYRAVGNRRGEAFVLIDLGTMHHEHGNPDRGASLLEQGLAAARAIGDRVATAEALSNLGRLARVQENPVHATRCHREALMLATELGDRESVIYDLCGLAGIAGATGRPERAARLLGAAEKALTELGMTRLQTTVQARWEHDKGQAQAVLGKQTFTIAWEAGRDLPLDGAVAEALALAEELAGAVAAASDP